MTTPVTGSQVRYNADYGAMLLTADQSTLNFQFVNRRGWTIDSYTLNTTPPSSQLPTAPAAAWATAVSSSQVNVTWTDLSNNESGFKVERSSDGVSFNLIGTTGANATTFTDSAGGSGFFYRVDAFNGAGTSAYTNITNVRTAGAGMPGPIDVGDAGGRQTFTGSVGDSQTSQYYRFTVPVTGTVSTLLTGLGSDADLWLIRADGAVIDRRPPVVRTVAVELAAAELADGHYEISAADFFIQRQGIGTVELFRAMGGEAVRGAAEFPAEHRHGGGVGAEVGVKVTDVGLFQPLEQHAGFSEVDAVNQSSALGSAADTNRQGEGTGEAYRATKHASHRRA